MKLFIVFGLILASKGWTFSSLGAFKHALHLSNAHNSAREQPVRLM